MIVRHNVYRTVYSTAYCVILPWLSFFDEIVVREILIDNAEAIGLALFQWLKLRISDPLYTIGEGEGQITDFFSYTSLEITKKSHIKITYRKHQKSQITEKLPKNHTKKSLKVSKITKKSQKNHVISKSHKSRTYAVLRSDLPLGRGCTVFPLFGGIRDFHKVIELRIIVDERKEIF